jgi:hypothetical protein
MCWRTNQTLTPEGAELEGLVATIPS